jgi:hypothetical protein
MTVVMAVPAMPMVMMIVSDRNDNLGARCRYQRNEEHKGEKTKRKFLHSVGCPTHVRVVELAAKFIVCAKPIAEAGLPQSNLDGAALILTVYSLSLASLHTLERYNQPCRWPIKF